MFLCYVLKKCKKIRLALIRKILFLLFTKSHEYIVFILSAIKRSNWNRGFTSVYLRSSRIILLKAYNIIKTSFILINAYMKYNVGDIINVTVPGYFFINNAIVGCPSQTYSLIFRLKYDEMWIFSNIWNF